LDRVLPEGAPLDLNVLEAGELESIKEAVLREALGTEQEAEETIRRGHFVKYADDELLLKIAGLFPGLIADGRFFDVPFAGMSERLKARSVSMIGDALLDVLWLRSESGSGAISKDENWRRRYAKALASLRLASSWRS